MERSHFNCAQTPRIIPQRNILILIWLSQCEAAYAQRSCTSCTSCGFRAYRLVERCCFVSEPNPRLSLAARAGYGVVDGRAELLQRRAHTVAGIITLFYSIHFHVTKCSFTISFEERPARMRNSQRVLHREQLCTHQLQRRWCGMVVRSPLPSPTPTWGRAEGGVAVWCVWQPPQ